MKLRSQPFDKLRAGSQESGARGEKHGTQSIGPLQFEVGGYNSRKYDVFCLQPKAKVREADMSAPPTSNWYSSAVN